MNTHDTGGARPAAPDAKSGGPAFPVAFTTTPLTGMTLRDYFAAMAMQALIADGGYNTYIARDAYAYADEMLQERAQ